MTSTDMAKALSLETLAGAGVENQITGCYSGDLLSWVMGRAQEGDAWITVMGNVNAIAVAKLAEIGAVILCEDSHLDTEAKAQADLNGVIVFSSPDPAYELAVKLSKLL